MTYPQSGMELRVLRHAKMKPAPRADKKSAKNKKIREAEWNSAFEGMG